MGAFAKEAEPPISPGTAAFRGPPAAVDILAVPGAALFTAAAAPVAAAVTVVEGADCGGTPPGISTLKLPLRSSSRIRPDSDLVSMYSCLVLDALYRATSNFRAVATRASCISAELGYRFSKKLAIKLIICRLDSKSWLGSVCQGIVCSANQEISKFDWGESGSKFSIRYREQQRLSTLRQKTKETNSESEEKEKD